MSSTQCRSSTTISIRPSEPIAWWAASNNRIGSVGVAAGTSAQRQRFDRLARYIAQPAQQLACRGELDATLQLVSHDHDRVLDLDEAGDLGEDP